MTRKEFISKVGIGGVAFYLPTCIGALAGCSSNNVNPAPTNVDFTIDVSSGTLATNGGFLVKNGIIIARTTLGDFLAVAASCTHEGTTIQYQSGSNNFLCPNHGSIFTASGQVTTGPANRGLTQYKTALTGVLLRVFS